MKVRVCGCGARSESHVNLGQSHVQCLCWVEARITLQSPNRLGGWDGMAACVLWVVLMTACTLHISISDLSDNWYLVAACVLLHRSSLVSVGNWEAACALLFTGDYLSASDGVAWYRMRCGSTFLTFLCRLALVAVRGQETPVDHRLQIFTSRLVLGRGNG